MIQGKMPTAGRLYGCLLALFLLAAPCAMADEGMWTFDGLPLDLLETKYGFKPSDEWLTNVRLASVRFNDGGSGSFVSPTGLVLTNHHVAVGQLQKMSSEEMDYVSAGFYAAKPEDEIPCTDLELYVLMSTEDVTDKVVGAVKEEMSEEEAVRARDAERARLEKESMDATGLRADVVSLYDGGEYWVYRYKKYTDVRLVWAPEKQAAFFGGDHDNFTYPRYDLDCAVFRVYENDEPIRPEHHLKIDPGGVAVGDLVFVSGHPGGSSRQQTVAQYEVERDAFLPMVLDLIDRIVPVLEDYASRGPEQARRAEVMIFGISNGRKALSGQYKALTDERVMEVLRKKEAELRARVEADPELSERYGTAWEKIDTLFAEHGEEIRANTVRAMLTRPFGAQMAGAALSLVLYSQEIEKPDAERLNGYHDSELEQRKFYLTAPVPMYRDLEAAMMEFSFKLALEKLPEGDALRAVYEGLGDPAAAAKRLAGESRLDDAGYRRELLEGGKAAIEASDDPLIAWARQVAPIVRETDKFNKSVIQAVTVPANEQMARARFAVYGKTVHPDANFTLRLAFGTVRGYPMNGTVAPYKTTLYGLFDRALGFDKSGEWELPQRFWDRKDKLDLSTPVNFVSDCDTIGGNSGSPVVNREANLVGLIFDGNIESLAGNYVFEAERNRSVAVHAAYILEALRKLYDAEKLAAELMGKTSGGEE
jgi:hypothetical protein